MDFTKDYGSLDPKTHAQWFEHEGSKFLIAPSNNVAFKNKTLEMFNMNEIQSNGLESMTAAKIVHIESQIKAHTILLDWENVSNDGKPLKYSIEVATTMWTNYEKFRTWVDQTSLKLQSDITENNDSKKKS
jgi:hypothetical protein